MSRGFARLIRRPQSKPMPRLFTPAHRPLVVPGSGRRVLRRPDLRHLVVPRLSGAPLHADEVDFDELVVHRSYRSYEPDRPGEVRYMMYELSQRDPGDEDFRYFWKAVRLARITRVPRYLRQAGANGSLVFEQQRDLLAALRERQVLFLNVVAKSPQLPLVFAYGVQAVGDTPEAAQTAADESWAVLAAQLDGLFQQLEYKPLTVEEGELLARYQAEWDHIAMARGRPLPTGGSLGAGSILDGNRTDVESTLNQLESFLRGMADRSFMLGLVTVPLSPAEMTLAWRNVTQKLSQVRSEQQGSRSVTAGIALPISLGASLGDSHGNTHSSGATHGVGASDGVSHSVADGVSHSEAAGVSHSVSDGVNSGVSHSQTAGVSHSVADSVNHGVTHGENVQVGQSLSHGIGLTHTDSQSLTHADSISQGVTHGQSVSHGTTVGQTDGMSQTESLSHGVSNSVGQSLAHGQNVGQSWQNSMGQSLSAGVNHADSWNESQANGLSQTVNLGTTHTDGLTAGSGESTSRDLRGGIPGLASGGGSVGQTSSAGSSISNAHSIGLSQSGSATHTTGVGGSFGQSLTQGLNWGESFGGSRGESLTDTRSVGFGESLTAGQSIGVSHATSVARSAGTSESLAQTQTVGQSVSQGVSASDALSRSLGIGENLSQGQSLAQSAGVGRTLSSADSLSQTAGVTQGQSHSLTQAQSLTATDAVSRTATAGTAQALTQNQALSDAYMVAMSRSAQQTTSFGAVPQFGVSISKATFDEAKRVIGDVLEKQMQRYIEGVESGAFLYQMFLVTPDRETLVGAASLLKAAFWGPGTADERLPQPFHVIVDFDPEEARRLLDHARAFTSYRRREPVMEIVEPFLYSSYVTPGEAAAFCHPPTAESLGLLAVHDSMPVLAMPADRQNRELALGHIVNGERGRVTDVGFGVDASELTHALVAGTTGSGKSTTLLRLLAELARVSRTVVSRPTPANPTVTSKTVRAGILGLDWMSNMRDLASIVEPDRFRFFSIAKPELGAFRWNPLAVPDEAMNPVDWANAVADNMTISFNLGEFGRSLIAEFLADLYSANRLHDTVLRKEIVDDAGNVVRPADILPAVDPATLPPGAVVRGPGGEPVANVHTCPALSRLVSMAHLATLVAAKVEELADPNAARLYGTAMRDRIQSLWRRAQYFAPGSPLAEMLACDERLDVRSTLGVRDLVDPERGLVTIIEADGLDMANRRFILGSVLLAVWRFGQFHGEGVFDHAGVGPGTFIALEEAHELFGAQGEDEDHFSAATRTALYESMFRRARALGLRLIAVVQNCGSIPEAITSNTSTVFVHRQYAKADRERVFSLLNWSNQLNQQLREWRYLGEMPRGYCIARLDARTSYLESAPVQFLTDPPALGRVDDAALAALAARR